MTDEQPSGIAVDASGGPVVDPTKNVLDLVDASVGRLDDLRDAELQYAREIRKAEDAHSKELRRVERSSDKELRRLTKKLTGEQLRSLRQEMDTKDKAQKEATTKAEKSAADTASALATELKSSRETTDARLGAIERGGAGIGGEKLGTSEIVERERLSRAEKALQKSNQQSAAIAVIALLALLRSAGVI